jgi:hypothetical protein
MSTPPLETGGRRPLRTSVLIGLICFLVYNANLRSISAGDAYPARYLPFGILRYGSLSLDPILPLVRQGSGGGAYWVMSVPGGHAVSFYPVVLPVLISPLYLPAALYLNHEGWPERSVERAARVMEKVAASLLAATAAALLYLLLGRSVSSRLAFWLALLFAFGTTTWVISSQALWQHGLAELLIVSALLLVTGPPSAAAVIAAGLVLGLIAGNRPPDALLAAALGFHALGWAQRRKLLLAAAVPAGLIILYNVVFVGHWAGGYGYLLGRSGGQFLGGNVLVGLAGLLFSPTHGLFVFSPFLLFVPFAFRRVWEDAGNRRLTLALGIGIVLQLFLYSKCQDWTGGEAWGPRYLTDLLPLVFWMLPPIVAALRGPARVAFALAGGAAIMIEGVGAFWYLHVSDGAILGAPKPMEAVWGISNAPFIIELSHPPATPELWPSAYRCDAVGADGSMDRMLLGTREVREILPDEEVRVEGWTLIGGRTPWDVAVTLDGQPIGATSNFLVRSDVVRARGSASPSGWSIPIRTAALAPGEHTLGVVARSCEAGTPQLVVQRRVVASDLRASARHAAGILKEHQSSAGYWLTSYTSAPRFEAPREEMNTFLTATLVDMLDPVAAEDGLGEALGRSRRHLAAQIEGDGLVRYHGRPDAPSIGQLGCVISPDADDTALVWRVAPTRDPQLLSAALTTLGQYRTTEGLYRTWLAPRNRYQCIDPGRDPNPTDIGIQMHVLMLLAREDPSAASALCRAMSRVVDEDRVWVYYGLAPLVPALRAADLERVGCRLSLPLRRRRSTVAGQEDWLLAAAQLWRLTRRDLPPPRSDETLALLSALAADDFAPLRANPPLLYHNDVTGSVPRFYWSQDFGYALWLRLFFEQERRFPPAAAPRGA